MISARFLLLLCTGLLLPLAIFAQIDDVGINFPAEFRPATSNIYAKVVDPTLSSAHLEDLPGFTRSVYKRDHALITPESHVYSPLPGWKNAVAAYFITPAMGAHFSFYLVHMEGNSTAGPPSRGVERLAFVVKGEATFSAEHHQIVELTADWYAYVPADVEHDLASPSGAHLLVVERVYTGVRGALGEQPPAPRVHVGSTTHLQNIPVPGEVFALRKLLPQTAPYDFNIHIMDFQPGEYLNVKEVHFNQHGLILLEGRGIYRLGDKWYPVQAGDVIWMAPFVPQWYAALGKTRSRYFLYKDTNRDPLLHP